MSGLETFLLSALSAFVACVLLMLSLSGQYVKKSECGLKHDAFDEMCTQQDLIFRMLRAVIIHLDIPPDEKERILNMTIIDMSKFTPQRKAV